MLRTHCQTSGVVAHRAGPVQQRRPHHDRGAWPRCSAAPRACTPTPSTRPSRCRPTSRPGSPATRSSSSRRRPASPTWSTRWAGCYYDGDAHRRTWPTRRGRSSRRSRRSGGMTKAVESGCAKLRIEEAAAREAGRDRLGRGRHRRRQQVPARRGRPRRHPRRSTTRPSASSRSPGWRRSRRSRDDARGASRRSTRLTRWRRAARATCWSSPIEAARARATVGEISDALEKVFGRHRATIRSIAGVYGAAYEGDEGWREGARRGR